MLLFNCLDEELYTVTPSGATLVPRAPRFSILLRTSPTATPLGVALEDGTSAECDLHVADAWPKATYFSPEPCDGVGYLVPEAVALSLPQRSDLFCIHSTRLDDALRTIVTGVIRPHAALENVLNLGDVLEEIPD